MKFLKVLLCSLGILWASSVDAARYIVEASGQMFYDENDKSYHFWVTMGRHAAPGEENWCPGTEKVTEATWNFICPTYPALGCSKFTFGVTDTTGMIYTRSEYIESAARYYTIPTVGCFKNTPYEVVITYDILDSYVTDKIATWLAGTDPYFTFYLGKVHVNEDASLYVYQEGQCNSPTPRCGAVFVWANDAASGPPWLGSDTYEWKGLIHEYTSPPFGSMPRKKFHVSDPEINESKLGTFDYIKP